MKRKTAKSKPWRAAWSAPQVEKLYSSADWRRIEDILTKANPTLHLSKENRKALAYHIRNDAALFLIEHQLNSRPAAEEIRKQLAEIAQRSRDLAASLNEADDIARYHLSLHYFGINTVDDLSHPLAVRVAEIIEKECTRLFHELEPIVALSRVCTHNGH